MSAAIGNCIICCCSFRPDKIAALPCGHTFHYDCVLQWVQTSKTCPSCRVRCIERNIIKTLYFNSDLDATIGAGEDELDSVKKELFDKKKECIEMEKKMTTALSECAVNLKERARWQRKAEEGAEAIKKVGQLKSMLVDQSEKEKEVKELRSKLKASKFYQVIVSGDSEEKLNKYIRSDGEVDTAHFLVQLKKQLNEANEKTKMERKRREEAEGKIAQYKRLAQELKENADTDKPLVERLNQHKNENRLSLGGDASSHFTDSFLASAMRPAPKGKLIIGGKKNYEECNTVLDTTRTRRFPLESPEKDAFDVILSKKVSSRIGHSEKMSNGMGREFSMKNNFDRLSTLPIPEKENRFNPYEKPQQKKKVVVAKNARLSEFFKKKEATAQPIDLNSTICID
ncbi:hypothetical protein PFISCL1PPCAC_6066 [Pristionchus fissidentatus]|uniref:RING-type domain-containing protein n=1 Tax=Pristionchus fissidentatus TaxID=1538716 RepID=A0AAV5VA61_9BILA|nr:hypothetical protein PFISCL1PPCAC_6066 [Pristionchus fissidentatus]